MTHVVYEYNSLLYVEEQLWYNILPIPHRIMLKKCIIVYEIKHFLSTTRQYHYSNIKTYDVLNAKLHNNKIY